MAHITGFRRDGSARTIGSIPSTEIQRLSSGWHVRRAASGC